MNWKIKAILQKLLALTKVGDQLNHIAAKQNKKYYSNVVKYQTYECLRKFDSSCVKIDETSVALDVGTGYSIISAIVLSLLRFKKIITVDITKDVKFSTFKKQLQYLSSPDILDEIVLKSRYTKEDLLNKIEFLKTVNSIKELCRFLNISYIAPYTFEGIEKECTSFSYISSQVVLEHMPPNTLELLYKYTKKWLTANGVAVHTINFIDHFANPGFFQDKSISEFNFLKYSDIYWKFWAGNSIAYTNRLSYLYYLELAKKHNLKVVDFTGENYRERVALDTKSIHPDILKKYSENVNPNDLMKYQRGTLILKQ